MTLPAVENQNHQTLKLRRLGIDTYTDPVIFMNRACHIFRSEGFEARARVKVALGQRELIATVDVVSDALLAVDEAGFSEFVNAALGGVKALVSAFAALLELGARFASPSCAPRWLGGGSRCTRN